MKSPGRGPEDVHPHDRQDKVAPPRRKRKKLWLLLSPLIAVVLVGLGTVVVALVKSPGKLAPLKDSEGRVLAGSISEKVWLDVNGIQQGMFLRGESADNPVVLYLHGGPGTPMLQFITALEKEERLEKYFTVAYWDQRGAGMTYSRSSDPATMTVDQMVDDTHKVTQYLKSRFGQSKIYLLGHSWGSYLGVKVIEKYPDDYLAYVGVGQVADATESERLTYYKMLDHAREIGDQEVVEKLEGYDPGAEGFPSLDYFVKVRSEILEKYGWGRIRRGASFSDILGGVLNFEGYTLPEKVSWFLGADFSMVHLLPVVLADDLRVSSMKFDIPFYVLQGAYDGQCSVVLAREYLDGLDAPKKGFFLFEESAHSPNMEEPEKFVEVFRTIASENPPSP